MARSSRKDEMIRDRSWALKMTTVLFMVALSLSQYQFVSTKWASDVQSWYANNMMQQQVAKTTATNTTPGWVTSPNATIVSEKILEPSLPAMKNRKSLSIVVRLSGEMGNNLSKIAFGKYLQWRLRDEYGIATHLVLRHQDSLKWEWARDSVQECFPNLRALDFEIGNTPEFDQRKEEQEAWLGKDESKKLELYTDVNIERLSRVQETMDYFASLVIDNPVRISNNESSTPSHSDPPPLVPSRANITLPFVYVDVFAEFAEVDHYYQQIRDFFAFDEQKCCNELPGEDESGFHFRNFATEMKKRAQRLGFEELNPLDTASALFGQLNPGDSVAITTRLQTGAELYESAFRERGLQARTITGQRGPQDFCFLTKVPHELAGSRVSTFFFWAAILSNPSTENPGKKWFYSIRSNFTLAIEKYAPLLQPYEFIHHPALGERIKFVVFDQ